MGIGIVKYLPKIYRFCWIVTKRKSPSNYYSYFWGVCFPQFSLWMVIFRCDAAILNKAQNIKLTNEIYIIFFLGWREKKCHRKKNKYNNAIALSFFNNSQAKSVYLFSFVSWARAKYKTVFCVVPYCVCVFLGVSVAVQICLIRPFLIIFIWNDRSLGRRTLTYK